jgi:hypothetical protein
MTLPSEVLRIFAKDLRLLRWPLVAWITFLALSVSRGLDVAPVLHEMLYPVAFVVPIMAAVIIALAVAGDPAQPGPTFWGVHQQRPLAVAGAKMVMALLLLAFMAIGHGAVLVSHGLSSGQVIALIIKAARDTGAWFLFAAALAACARDAKGWLLGAALAGVLAFLLSSVAGDHSGFLPIAPFTRTLASYLLAAVSVSAIAWAYRAHLTGIRAEVRTAMLVVIAALVLVTPRDSMAYQVDDRTLRPDSAMIIHTDRIASRIERGAVIVDVPVTYPDSSYVVGATTTWRLQLRDGSTVDLLPRNPRVRRTAKLLEPEENFALWGRGPVARILAFRYPLDSATLTRVVGNLSSVTLALHTDRLLMRRTATFPADVGGTVAHEGVRLHLEAAEDARFATSASSVWIPAGIDRRIPNTVAFASGPWLALVPTDGSAVRPLTGARNDHSAEMRTPSWVLPGNEIHGSAGSLIPAGAPMAGGGSVVAIAGDYAGRIAQAIRAPYKP